MGRSRANPKLLKIKRYRFKLKQARPYNPGLTSHFHGNPRSTEKLHILDDGWAIDLSKVNAQVSVERERCLAKAELWQGDFHQGVSEYCFLKVINKFYPAGIRRYFSGQKQFFLWMQDDHILRSIVYQTKDIAMMAFNTGRITWIERISRLVSPPPVP